MAHNKWCGKQCCECNNPCEVDLEMLCSPDCEAINPKTNLPDRTACISCGADLIEITQEEAEQIIENYYPLGKFYRKEGNLFIGIDNETGDAWTEEFKSQEECFIWLYREEKE